jgi:hypothetical protein
MLQFTAWNLQSFSRNRDSARGLFFLAHPVHVCIYRVSFKISPPWSFLITCLILQISKWNLQHLSPTYIGTILQHIIEIDNVLTKLLHFLYHCCKMQSDHARALWSHPLNNNLIFFFFGPEKDRFHTESTRGHVQNVLRQQSHTPAAVF